MHRPNPIPEPMTRKERLVYCKKCQNRDFNLTQGILCGLTGAEAQFEGDCPDFLMDEQNGYIRQPKESVRPNANRAKNAELFIWVVLAVGAASFISSLLQYDLLTTVENGGAYTNDQLTINDLRESVIGILHILIYITAAIVFLQWFRRAYYNLNLRMNTKHDDSWALGAWFVPILCLFRPYQMMKEIDEGLGVLIEKRSAKPEKNNTTLIGIWWTLWVIANYIGQFVFRSSLKANTIEELLNSTLIHMVSFIPDIPLAIVAALLIRKTAKKEVKLLQLEQEEYRLKVA